MNKRYPKKRFIKRYFSKVTINMMYRFNDIPFSCIIMSNYFLGSNWLICMYMLVVLKQRCLVIVMIEFSQA